MGTNEGWPEAFGFSVSGGSPVVVSSVEEGGSAQQAGLQLGDVITELDGVDVQQWNLEQVVTRARGSAKVPPSLVVISRVRHFRLRRDGRGGYGVTLRGDGPVFIRSVDVPSPAREAGLRSGDLLLAVDSRNVRKASKVEVLEIVRGSGEELAVTVIAGGLDWSLSAPPPPSLPSSSSTSLLTRSHQSRNKARYQKAALFHNQVNYYLVGEREKKGQLFTLLRVYAASRDVDSLASSLDLLLEGPIQRRLIPAIREYIQPRHQTRFDALLSPPFTTPTRRMSVDNMGEPRPLAATRGAAWTSSLPSLAPATEGVERLVRVTRVGGGFGLSLSGNVPVFIRSVDRGGPAERAGLRPWDTLLAINGLNIRNATHSHVVRLLRGSGTSPSLLVSSPMSERPGSTQRGLGGASQRGGVAPYLSVGGEKRESLRQKMAAVLMPQERERVMRELNQFSRHKDIPKLVEGLQVLLGDPAKMQLFHHVCQLLPEEAQAEFDRLAARSLQQDPFEGDILEDTAIGSVGESGGMMESAESVGESGGVMERAGDRGRTLGPLLELEEAGEARESAPLQPRDVRPKRKSLENTPVGQSLAALLNGASTSLRRQSHEATPSTPMNDITASTTPGTVPPPPPTPAGGIPPPPPLPTSPTPYQPHMRRVNWQKMNRTDGTIWGEMSGLDEAIELAELDSQFALRKSKEPSEVQGRRKPSVIDSKKAYNISILLSHLKMSPAAIREAVLACNHSILGEQHIRLMATFAPDKRECLGLARYYDNPSILSLPDQFSCEMSTIPCYQERLNAMLFRIHYWDKVEEIQPDLEAICQASEQLQKSSRLKKLLELVLAIGNHMNMGNIRIGQAQGFRVGFLSQLRGLRTTDGQSTLLHFLAGLTERKFQLVLNFHEDLSACPRAARVSGQTLEAEVNELSLGLRNIRQSIIEIDSGDELPGDRFHDIMSGFLGEAEGRTAELLALYSHMKQQFRQVVQFYGEDPAKTRVDDFFTIFASFTTDFQKAVCENQQARQKQAEEWRQREQGRTKGRGQVNRPRPSSRDQYTQFKEELEKTRLKPIPRNSQSRTEQRQQQTDFTHMLRPTHDRAKLATPTKPLDKETIF